VKVLFALRVKNRNERKKKIEGERVREGREKVRKREREFFVMNGLF